MATYIQTKDVGITIDPGVSLCPNRFGFPPHRKEEERKEVLWKQIKEKVAASQVVIVTHYHFDHFDPKEPDIYKGKALYVKHPTQRTNHTQRRRALDFLGKVRGLAEKILYADGLRISLGSTDITFSNSVYHGISPTLGFVLEICVEEDRRFLYTSDVQGPALKEQIEFIFEKDAETLYVDGPMTYMLGEAYPKECLEAANSNLIEIVVKTNVRKLILDHHLTRDFNYKGWIGKVYEAAEERGISVITAAEFLGGTPELLEARRRELHQEEEDGERRGA